VEFGADERPKKDLVHGFVKEAFSDRYGGGGWVSEKFDRLVSCSIHCSRGCFQHCNLELNLQEYDRELRYPPWLDNP